MPFLSKAQRAYFQAKKNRGEISQQVLEEWESDTPTFLPPRVKKAGNEKKASLRTLLLQHLVGKL